MVSCPQTKPETGRATVLCVEDEEPQLTLRKLLLETVGFEVLTATSGRKAIALFKAHHVDAVVMDYWMDDMKGAQAAMEMKHLRPEIAIVMFSGFWSLPGEELGCANVWLHKVETAPEDLIRILKRLLGSRKV